MDSIMLFLKEDILPEEKSEANKVRRKAPQFWLSEDQSYTSTLFRGHIYYAYTWGIRATFGGVTWRDLWKPHRRQILISQSPYSGILVADHVEGSTRICEEVWPMTKFALNIHQPGGVLNPLPSPWPFAQWALDIVEPFLKVVGNRRWLLVGTDYFTK